MNFKHVLILAGVLIVGIVAFQFFTRLDRTDPLAVADGFTAAMKDRDMEAAASYFAPADAAAWREYAQTRIDKMKSGAMDNYFAGIPDEPGYTLPTGGANESTLSLVSADKAFTIEMAKTEDEWFVTKAAY